MLTESPDATNGGVPGMGGHVPAEVTIPPQNDRWINTTQIADMKGVHPTTVAGWMAMKKFPSARKVKAGKRTYWEVLESEVIDFTPPRGGAPRGRRPKLKDTNTEVAPTKPAKEEAKQPAPDLELVRHIAFATGHTQGWLETYAASIGIPIAVLRAGVSDLLKGGH